MSTASPAYQTKQTLAMTLASLASSSTLVAGRESTAADNTTDDAIDCLVGGKITVGTTPTANTQIQVWAYGSYDGTEFSGSAAGADGALTPSAKELMRLLVAIPSIAATSNLTHKWGPYSIAQAFGGVVPPKWGIWITHNTVAALHATAGNHEVEYTPVKFESA